MSATKKTKPTHIYLLRDNNTLKDKDIKCYRIGKHPLNKNKVFIVFTDSSVDIAHSVNKNKVKKIPVKPKKKPIPASIMHW